MERRFKRIFIAGSCGFRQAGVIIDGVLRVAAGLALPTLVLAANEDCKHLLAQRSSSATPEQQQQKLGFGVKVAGCLRAHGYPSFPDPPRLGSQPLPPGVDLDSPEFQAAETACEKHERKALGLP